jgi:hypothetical protein
VTLVKEAFTSHIPVSVSFALKMKQHPKVLDTRSFEYLEVGIKV